MKLSATRVRTLRQPGRYSDGGGLYYVIRPTGSRAWVQRVVVDGRRRDIGLGPYPVVSLADARKRCADNRTAIANGIDPVTERKERSRAVSVPTLREATQAYYELHLPNLKNGKHRTNWMQVLERHAMPRLGDIPVDRIDGPSVLGVLVPVWTSRPPTARRVRQRLRKVFGYCLARGHISVNPAGEVIDGGLPPQPRSKNHFRALHYSDVAEALEIVEGSTASLSAKLCLRFLVLTAARSGEARGATWDEIDLEARTWTIPASRMKAGVEHRVPLSDQAVEVLERVRSLVDGSGFVFPSPMRPGRAMSDMALTVVLRNTGLAERATVHGFRTSFKTWTMEQTDTPWAVGEAALAHTIGNSVEAAYARSDLFERRRTLMQDWADYGMDDDLERGLHTLSRPMA